MTRDSLILVFGKAPQSGRVKTRLAQDLGPGEALRIYDRMARHLWDTVCTFRVGKPVQIWLCFDPPDQAEAIQAWLTGADRYLAQVQSNLGRRLAAGIQEGQALGFNAIAVIGMDTPDLSHHHLEAAFKCVAEGHVALGPSEDGGFYLLAGNGQSFKPESLVEGIRWSSSETLSDLLANLEAMGLPTRLLPRLHDIDTLEDLRRHQSRDPGAFYPL